MVSYLFYYQLALLASIWLFVMLHLIWPKRGVPSTTASVMPVVKPQRQGIKEPIARSAGAFPSLSQLCVAPRQPRLIPEVANGTGSARMWRPCTPAMAAGLTNHVWSLKEGRRYLVPPWPQPQAR